MAHAFALFRFPGLLILTAIFLLLAQLLLDDLKAARESATGHYRRHSLLECSAQWILIACLDPVFAPQFICIQPQARRNLVHLALQGKELFWRTIATCRSSRS